MSSRLFVTEPDVSDACFLCIASQVGYGNAHDSKDGFHPIHFQGIYQEVHAIGERSIGIIFNIIHYFYGLVVVIEEDKER